MPVPDRLNVRFTGGIRDRRDLARLLAAADVFVSASLMETYGLTLVEAMACGTPVVAFRVGGIPEAAPDGQGAILCAAGDGAALIEAITKLRNSPQLATALGKLAHETAHNRNAASSFANAFAQLYRECVSSREDAQAQTTSSYDVKVQAPFGFVTGCHAGDKFMVQATLASMRHYCPDVPICLTVDGDFDVSDLEKEYDLIVLRVSELSSETMRKLVSGSGRAKLAAMWEGPFEFYVWLDSDAIVWGDFTPQVRTDVDFQIFWSEISIPADATEIPPWLPHFYFDPQKLKRFDPEFDWRGHAVFFFRRLRMQAGRYPIREMARRGIVGTGNAGVIW